MAQKRYTCVSCGRERAEKWMAIRPGSLDVQCSARGACRTARRKAKK